MSFLPVVGIALFSLVLIKSTDVLVFHLKELARKTNLGGYFLSALIVGLATSLPELSVGITSALSGIPHIALGNAIGSNITNLSLIAGGAALVSGSIRIHNHSYGRDLLYAFLAGLAPLFLLMDNVLSRVDGLILITLYGFYHYFLLKKRIDEMDGTERGGVFIHVFNKLRHNGSARHLAIVFVGVALILFSGGMIVRFGIAISDSMNISMLLVGIVFISLGTTLPEFVVNVKAIRRREATLFMGNILGTIIANGTLVVGITALLSPITVRAISDYLIATIFYISIFIFFYFFVRTREKLQRWEGGLLVWLYILFVTIEFL